MDGFELAERLRTDSGLDRIPFIAITGYAQEIDRRRTTSSRFHGHLVKPVDVLDHRNTGSLPLRDFARLTTA